MKEFGAAENSGDKKDNVKFTVNNVVPAEFFGHLEHLLKTDTCENTCTYWHDSVKYRLGIYASEFTPESKNWGNTHPIQRLDAWFFKPTYVDSDRYVKQLHDLFKKYGVTQFTWLDTGPWNLISIRTSKLAITLVDSPFRVSNSQLERETLLNDVLKGTKDQTTAQVVEQWKEKRGF